MFYKRILDVHLILEKKKSQFLFGPRGTGKSTLIREQFGSSVFILDLLNTQILSRLSGSPHTLYSIIKEQSCNVIVIDEIQKIPQLLDEVHRLLEEPNNNYIFILTGSSSRKLKKQFANFLGGRAGRMELFPLTTKEVGDTISLDKLLNFGFLPRVIASHDPQQELYDYIDNYIKEEIQIEAAVRNLPPFSRFLKSVALSNSQIINYSSFSRDVGVSVPTIKEYFNILVDTLIGFNVEPWNESKKRKSIVSHRFYFFDLGVTRTLAETTRLDRNSNLYGQAFEQFIALELRAYLSYYNKRKSLTFWRTRQGDEVDFVIGDDIAIEVKSSQKVQKNYLRGLEKIKEENKIKKFFLVSHDEINQNIDGVSCLFWKDFLSQLWSHKIL